MRKLKAEALSMFIEGDPAAATPDPQTDPVPGPPLADKKKKKSAKKSVKYILAKF